MIQILLQIFSPRLRRSARTASMPFLSMVRRAAVERRSFTQRFSLATQNRRSCRLGRKRRRVLFMACETLLPVVVRLPVTWHTRDITHLEKVCASLGQGGGGPDADTRSNARITRHGSGLKIRCTMAGRNRVSGSARTPLGASRTQRAAHYAGKFKPEQALGAGRGRNRGSSE